jgi:hypothetical protein
MLHSARWAFRVLVLVCSASVSKLEISAVPQGVDFEQAGRFAEGIGG